MKRLKRNINENSLPLKPKQMLSKLDSILNPEFNKLVLTNSFNRISVDSLKQLPFKCLYPSCLLSYSTERSLYFHLIACPHDYTTQTEKAPPLLNNHQKEKVIKIRCPTCHELFVCKGSDDFISVLKAHCENTTEHNKYFLSKSRNITKILKERPLKTEQGTLDLISFFLNPIKYLKQILDPKLAINRNTVFEILFLKQILLNSFKGLYLFLVKENKYICRFAGCHKILGSSVAVKYHMSYFPHPLYELFIKEIDRLKCDEGAITNYNFEYVSFDSLKEVKEKGRTNLISMEDYTFYKTNIYKETEAGEEYTDVEVYNHFKESCKSIFNLKEEFIITGGMIYVGTKQDHQFPILMELKSNETIKTKFDKKTYFFNRFKFRDVLKSKGVNLNEISLTEQTEEEILEHSENYKPQIESRQELYENLLKKYKIKQELEKHKEMPNTIRHKKIEMKIEAQEIGKLHFKELKATKLFEKLEVAMINRQIRCILKDIKDYGVIYIAFKPNKYETFNKKTSSNLINKQEVKQKTILIKLTGTLQILKENTYSVAFEEMIHFNNKILVKTKKGKVYKINTDTLKKEPFTVSINNFIKPLKKIDYFYAVYDFSLFTLNKLKETKTEEYLISNKLWIIKKNKLFLISEDKIIFEEEFDTYLKQIITYDSYYLLLMADGMLYSYKINIFKLKNCIKENTEKGQLTKLERNYGYTSLLNLYPLENSLNELKYNLKKEGEVYENKCIDILFLLKEFRNSIIVKNNFRGLLHKLEIKHNNLSTIQLLGIGFFVICKYLKELKCLIGVTAMSEVYLIIGVKQKEKIFLFKIFKDLLNDDEAFLNKNKGKLVFLNTEEDLKKHLKEFNIENNTNLNFNQILLFSDLLMPVDIFFFENVFTLFFKGGLIFKFKFIF